MTVIRPNSISGITSITAQANEINMFRSDGTLAGLQINGINFNNTSGISTLAALNVTGNVSIAGTLTYEDVTNVDSIGIITARNGIDCNENLDVAGIGTIGSGGSGQAILQYQGSTKLTTLSWGVHATGTFQAIGNLEALNSSSQTDGKDIHIKNAKSGGGVKDVLTLSHTNNNSFITGHVGDISINAPTVSISTNFTVSGKVGINSTAPNTRLDVIESSASRTWTPGSSVVSMFERNGHCRIAMVAGSSSYSSIDFGDTSNDNSGYIKYDHNDNSMSFRTNSNVIDKLRILSDGKIGIGTDPTYGLDIMHDTGIIVRTSTNGVGAAISFTDASINNWDQIGTIKYLHQNNIVENGIAEGFIIQGTEATTAVKIEGLLRVTAQPCASVYECTGPSGNNITSDSQNGDPLHFNHVDIEQGGMIISDNNARIEVPVNGIYLVTMMIAGSVVTVDQNDGIEFNLKRNGTEYPASNSRAEPVFNFGSYKSTSPSGESEFFCTNMLYVQCTRGDYLELAVSNINNSDATINRGNFGVMLMA